MKDKFSAAFNEAGGIHAYTHDTSIAPYTNIAPSLQPLAAQLEHHQRHDSMEKLLQSLGKTKEIFSADDTDDNKTHETETLAPKVITTSFLIESLKEIREDVLNVTIEKKNWKQVLLAVIYC